MVSGAARREVEHALSHKRKFAGFQPAQSKATDSLFHYESRVYMDFEETT